MDDSGGGSVDAVASAAAVAQDLPGLHAGKSVFDAGSDSAVGDVVAFLPAGEIYAVYDATGAGTGFIAATDKRVILQDKSFAGKKMALVSLPYSRITSVAVTSNKSLMGHFPTPAQSRSALAPQPTRWSSENRKRPTTCTISFSGTSRGR